MAKRQCRLLHGLKLAEATRERAKNFFRVAAGFPCADTASGRAAIRRMSRVRTGKEEGTTDPLSERSWIERKPRLTPVQAERQETRRRRPSVSRRSGIRSGPDSRAGFCPQTARAIWRQDPGSGNSVSKPAIKSCSSRCFLSIYSAGSTSEAGSGRKVGCCLGLCAARGRTIAGRVGGARTRLITHRPSS